MWMLPVTLLIIGFTSEVHMETCPSDEDISPCHCEDNMSEGIEVICSKDAEDFETLKQVINSLLGKNDVDVVLHDLKTGTLPADIFKGIGVKKLELDYCDLDGLPDDDEPRLVGLENSLEELLIFGSFTDENVPKKLNIGHLKKLKEVDISYNIITELPDSWFNDGPSSLEVLILSNNGIEKLGDNAFAQLSNLKKLSLDGNRFGPIKRSMFPSTADKLEEIELDNNALTGIPEDLFRGMPSISRVSLRTNGITTLEERTWSPIFQQLDELRLEGNNIYCDDRLNWIARLTRRPFISGECSAPEKFKGQSLKEFIESLSR